jgi:hypothetical protein
MVALQPIFYNIDLMNLMHFQMEFDMAESSYHYKAKANALAIFTAFQS